MPSLQTAREWHILSICLFPCITLTGISLSVLLAGSKKGNELYFSLGVMFSAGVLLAAGFLHMLPDATRMFEDATGNVDGTMDKWSFLVCGATFLVLLSIEVFVERAVDIYFKDKKKGFIGIPSSSEHADGCNIKNYSSMNTIYSSVDDNSSQGREGDRSDDELDEEAFTATMFKISTRDSSFVGARKPVIDLYRKEDGLFKNQYLVTSKRPSVIGLKQVNAVDNIDEKQTVNPWVAMVLLIMMSGHVLIEGLALGASRDPGEIKTAFIAIVFHKIFSSFSVGSSFITAGYWNKHRSGGRKLFYFFSMSFASMDVIGQVIGCAIGHGDDGIGTAILVSMLAGSFVFVSTMELIPGEIEKTRVFKFHLLPVLSSIVVGYAAMGVLALYE